MSFFRRRHHSQHLVPDPLSTPQKPSASDNVSNTTPNKHANANSIRKRVSTIASLFSGRTPSKGVGHIAESGYQWAYPSSPEPSPTSPDIRRPSGLGRRASSLESSQSSPASSSTPPPAIIATDASAPADDRRRSRTLSSPNALPSAPYESEKTLPPRPRVPTPMAPPGTDRGNRLSRMEPGLGLGLVLLPVEEASPPPSLRSRPAAPPPTHALPATPTHTPARTRPASLLRIPAPLAAPTPVLAPAAPADSPAPALAPAPAPATPPTPPQPQHHDDHDHDQPDPPLRALSPPPPLRRIRRTPLIPLSLVCAHVAPRDLPALARVSRRFRTAARGALYRAVDLSARSHRAIDQCVTLLASARDIAELVHEFTCPAYSGDTANNGDNGDNDDEDGDSDGAPPSFLLALTFALRNMRHLTTLTLPRFAPAVLRDAPFRLQRLTLLQRAMGAADARALFNAWLPRQQRAITHFAAPHLAALADADASDARDEAAAAAGCLARLTHLEGTPQVVARLLACGRAVGERRRVVAVTLHISSTLYDGLRPAALMSAIARGTACVLSGDGDGDGDGVSGDGNGDGNGDDIGAGVDAREVATSSVTRLAIVSAADAHAVDARTLAKLLLAAGAELPALREVRIGWALEDEDLYRHLPAVLPRMQNLETLRLSRVPPAYPLPAFSTSPSSTSTTSSPSPSHPHPPLPAPSSPGTPTSSPPSTLSLLPPPPPSTASHSPQSASPPAPADPASPPRPQTFLFPTSSPTSPTFPTTTFPTTTITTTSANSTIPSTSTATTAAATATAAAPANDPDAQTRAHLAHWAKLRPTLRRATLLSGARWRARLVEAREGGEGGEGVPGAEAAAGAGMGAACVPVVWERVGA